MPLTPPLQTGPTAEAPTFFSPQVLSARRFYLDLNPARTLPLAVVCGGCENCAPDYRVDRRTFPFHSIEYVALGRGRLRLGPQELTLRPGTIFAYGPGIPHRIESDPLDPLVKYFVDFTGRRSGPLLRSCQLPPGRARQCIPSHDLQPLFEEILRSGQRGAPQSPELCNRLLECVVLRIADSGTPSEGPEPRSYTTYHACHCYISQHFRELRTIEQVAAACHLNAAYLCRLFRRYDHQSPHRFLLRLKMNLAAELLQHPQSLVKQVAEEVGFSDPFHFSRAFKAFFGLAPDRFRRLR